ncbi:hypothetical protein ALC62_03456, partial [Cyphomyrmex costatus]
RKRERERERWCATVDPPVGILPEALPHESGKYPPSTFYTLKKMKFRGDVSHGMNRSPQRDGQGKGTSMLLYPSI